MTSRLQDRWVLITGASSGFGAAAAVAFARAGARLLLGARRTDRLAEVAERARAAGSPAAHWQALDVASTASVTDFTRWARDTAGKVDVLVNNAGGALGLEPITAGRDEDWEGMVQSNLLGVLRMIRAIVPLMPRDDGALVLNIGSIAARTPYENGAAYCAVKAGELALTRSLRLELCGSGIRVGTLDPGMAETEFSKVRFKGDDDRARQVYAGVEPLTGEDVAEAMLWMASRPPHVCIDEMVIKPTDQAAIHRVHRRNPKPSP